MLSGRAHRAIRTALAACIAASAVLARPAAHDRTTQVTWTTDVEPILKSRCVGCHTTGGFAPLPLDTYEAARAAARAIRDQVLERRMPPWPAARGFGDFANDRTLTPIEVELLTAWTDGATPLGPPVVPAAAAARSRRPREPDLVITAPSVDVIGPHRQFVIATSLPEERYIVAWEFRPGNRVLVEQAVLSVAPGTRLGAWTPPEGLVSFPDGVTQRLPPRARVVLDVRYRKSPTPQTDRSAVALYFSSQPGRPVRSRSLGCGATVIDRGIDALALTPRLAAAGESMEIVATRPDGRVDPLCVIPRFEPGYPLTYRFRAAVALPRGTALSVRSSSQDCSVDLSFVASRPRPAGAHRAPPSIAARSKP
jgi:hypothetical protein